MTPALLVANPAAPAAAPGKPKGGGGGAATGFGPLASKVRVTSVPEFFIFTLPAVSSMVRTSSGPARCPSARIMESSADDGPPLVCTGLVFSSARLSPRIVVIPVRVTCGNGGAGASVRETEGAVNPNTLRSGMVWYRARSVSTTLAWSDATLNARPKMVQVRPRRFRLILAIYTGLRGLPWAWGFC